MFIYSFTHSNIFFLFKHLPTEIVIFINVCYQVKHFSGDRFSFLGAGFANIPRTFLIIMWSWKKLFKDIKMFSTVPLRSFIRYQDKNLDLFWISCCFQFFLHCLVQPKQVIHFLFYIILFLVNLYFVCFWNIDL